MVGNCLRTRCEAWGGVMVGDCLRTGCEALGCSMVGDWVNAPGVRPEVATRSGTGRCGLGRVTVWSRSRLGQNLVKTGNRDTAGTG